jgi:alkenylglycerophosphocholine hydrolase
MTFTFLWIGLVIAVLDWVAVAKQWKAVEYIAKPGVTLALLAWLWNAGGWQGHLLWFVIGLAFSLAGDILLVLPREQLIAGLVAFLLAQMAYIGGLNQIPPPINLASIAIALLVAVTALRIYGAIVDGLAATGRHSLKMPVLAYVAAISLMLISALLTLIRSEWDPGAAWLLSSGAILFFVSDALLGWNKFVRQLRYGNIQVIITYHLGQALIVLGVAVHFTK